MAAPAYKSATTTTQNSGSAPSLVIPDVGDGAAVGDFAILVLSTNTGTVDVGTDPAGWDQVTGSPTSGTASGGRLYVYTRTFEAGDLGATVTWDLSSSSRAAIACITTDPATLDASGKDETNSSGTSVVAPSVDPTTAEGLLVVINGTVTNASATQPTWTADAATVERVDITSTSGTLRNATILIATETLASGDATGTRTATPTQAVQRQGWSLVLAPADAGTVGAVTATTTAVSTVTAARTDAAASTATTTAASSVTAARSDSGAVTATTTVAGTVTAARTDTAAVSAVTTATATATGARSDSAVVTATTTAVSTATAADLSSATAVVSTTTTVVSTVTATVAAVTAPVGSWWGLVSILHEARDMFREDRERDPVACPNDGEPLERGPDGRLHCPFDGFRWPR